MSSEWRATLGVVPQDIKLFSGTLLDNIGMGDNAAEAQQIIDFCKKFGFDTYFKEFPQSYVTLLGEDGQNISGGQKQLVALARALYLKPGLLLLDEPTAAMDRNMEQFVLNLLQNIKADMGIILVTHRPRPASFANRIFIIEDGRIIENETPQKLKLSTNLYSESLKTA